MSNERTKLRVASDGSQKQGPLYKRNMVHLQSGEMSAFIADEVAFGNYTRGDPTSVSMMACYALYACLYPAYPGGGGRYWPGGAKPGGGPAKPGGGGRMPIGGKPGGGMPGIPGGAPTGGGGLP